MCQLEINIILLYCDNPKPIALAKKPENHQCSKQIDVWYNHIRKKEGGTIAIDYLPIEGIIWDKSTKALIFAKMKTFFKQLELSWGWLGN